MHDSTYTFDAARRFDPTGTTDIRSRFRGDLAKRWQQLRALANRALNEDDLLGLGAISTQMIARSADPVHEFQTWFDLALARLFGDGTFTQHYLDEAAARARSRAYKLVPVTGPSQTENVHPIVTASAAVEVQGVMEAVSQQAVRAVAQGLLAKARASQIARSVADVINRIGRTRGEALAEVAVNQAFNNATLDTFQTLGLSRVNTVPEHVPTAHVHDAAFDAPPPPPRVPRDRPPSPSTQARIERIEKKLGKLGTVEVLTAGDDDVCPICQAISKQGPYSIDTARSLIPAHPRCRCAFVPYFDERFAKAENDEAQMESGDRRPST